MRPINPASRTGAFARLRSHYTYMKRKNGIIEPIKYEKLEVALKVLD